MCIFIRGPIAFLKIFQRDSDQPFPSPNKTKNYYIILLKKSYIQGWERPQHQECRKSQNRMYLKLLYTENNFARA